MSNQMKKEDANMGAKDVLQKERTEMHEKQNSTQMSESEPRAQETHEAERSKRNSMVLNVRDIKQKKKSKKLEIMKKSLQLGEAQQIAEFAGFESNESTEQAAPRHASYRAYQVLKEAKRMKKDGTDKKRKGADTRERISLRQLIQELRQGTNVLIRGSERTTQITKSKSIEKSSPSMGGGSQMQKKRPK